MIYIFIGLLLMLQEKGNLIVIVVYKIIVDQDSNIVCEKGDKKYLLPKKRRLLLWGQGTDFGSYANPKISHREIEEHPRCSFSFLFTRKSPASLRRYPFSSCILPHNSIAWYRGEPGSSYLPGTDFSEPRSGDGYPYSSYPVLRLFRYFRGRFPLPQWLRRRYPAIFWIDGSKMSHFRPKFGARPDSLGKYRDFGVYRLSWEFTFSGYGTYSSSSHWRYG